MAFNPAFAHGANTARHALPRSSPQMMPLKGNGETFKNYPTRKGLGDLQTQKNGFGGWMQKFQLASGKSKYGVPIFLPNGNLNPAYLAAEQAEKEKKAKNNVRATEVKRKKKAKNNVRATEV